jgi:hypothetical protein
MQGRSSRRLTAPPEYHRCVTTFAIRRCERSSQGLFPFDVFPAVASHLSPMGTHAHRLCCALRVSHPLNALLPPRPAELISSRSRPWGFPTGSWLPHGAVRPLERRSPPDVGSLQAARLALRAWHTMRRPSAGPRFSRIAALATPLGFSSLRFLANLASSSSDDDLPSRAFPSSSTGDVLAGAPGYQTRLTHPHLSPDG